MNNFVIMTDSSCDLPESLAKELDLTILPLSVVIEGREYKNDLIDADLSIKDYYTALRAKAHCTTSAVNVDMFQSAMIPILESGRDILLIALSSGLSNTYNAGEMAAGELRPKFPDRKIITVDSLCASAGQGMLLFLAVQKKRAGASLPELAGYVEDIKLKICHWYTVEDLFFLKRGGRVSSTTALLGSMLQIKPVMNMNDEGKLIPISKVRGRRQSIMALAEKVGEFAVDPKSQTMFISHGDCLKEAEFLAETLKKDYGVKEVILSYVGPVIGTHSGPGTIAMFFLGAGR